MGIDIVTKEDLQQFRKQLLDDITFIIQQAHNTTPEPLEGYKTKHVRQILGCSVNKLVSLRVSRKLRTKKVGGTVYYNKDDVKLLLEEGW